jgi:hypothetical protein
MSMEVVRAVLGEDAVKGLSATQVAALAHELDAEILKDEELTARLGAVVKQAVAKVQQQSEAGTDAAVPAES